MRTIFVFVVGCAIGCENTEVENGDGTVTVIVEECSVSTENFFGNDAGADPPGVVATCDDHLPCSVDVQCTPCSIVPESIRFVKATCTPDEELSPFCFDSASGALTYTGCMHFIADITPTGTLNACFPVANTLADQPKFSGVCNAYGVCVAE